MKHKTEANTHIKFSRSPGILLKRLTELFDLDRVILLDGKLYEQLDTDPSMLGHSVRPKHQYRMIISDDDYDYVTDPGLIKKLNRKFGQLS